MTFYELKFFVVHLHKLRTKSVREKACQISNYLLES
jgi:hypothetical protein